LANDIYAGYRDRLQVFYKLVLHHFKQHPTTYIIFGAKTPEDVDLVCAAIGSRVKVVADKRSLEQKVRDFWYSGGLLHWVSETFHKIAALMSLVLSADDRMRIADAKKPDPIHRQLLEPEVEWAREALRNKYEIRGRKSEQVDCATSLTDLSRDWWPLGEIEILRRIASKTWVAYDERPVLSPLEVLTLARYVSSLRIELDLKQLLSSGQDPFSSRERKMLGRFSTKGTMFGVYFELALPVRSIEMVVAQAYADFWDELIYFNMFESYKGSMQCVECGRFIARSFDGYNQKYCSDQCKKRKNKRDYKRRLLLKDRLLK